MKLLVVAPTCDGEDVGEAWVAYQWVKRLAERHDLTVLTYTKRGSVPLSKQMPGLHVVEWGEMPLVGRAERLNSMLKPSYVPFLVRARRWIRDAQRAGAGYEVGHQPTPVAMRYPTPFLDSGIPYIIGPVGGGLGDPPGFATDGDTAPWYVGLRSMDGWRLHHDPLVRRSYEQADCVLGIAPYVREHLQGLRLRDFRVMSETALEALPKPVDRTRRCGPVRLIFVGRVIRTKGARDVVRAVSLLPDVPLTLDVIGDGFDLAECRRLAEELDISDRVTFHGKLERSDVDEYYRSADVFVFPSYREPGGNVVFEAMGFGLPAIVCDRGGPGSATDSDCAIQLSATSPRQFASDIAEAIRTLASDQGLRLRMGLAARTRAEEIALWDRKVDDIGRLYQQVAGLVT